MVSRYAHRSREWTVLRISFLHAMEAAQPVWGGCDPDEMRLGDERKVRLTQVKSRRLAWMTYRKLIQSDAQQMQLRQKFLAF